MGIIGFLSSRKKPLQVGFLALVLAFLATFPQYAKAYDVRVLTFILIYVVLAASWAMFSGTTGYMSLAPAAFFGVGMYAMALLQHQLPFPLIMAIGGVISFAFAALVGLVTLRLKGMYFAIFTFGLVVFMIEIVQYLETRLYGKHGQAIIPIDNHTLFYIMIGVAVATVLVTYLIRRSRWGLALLGIGGNEEAAEHMGVNTTRVKVVTFALSAAFMGVAGVVAAPVLIYVNSNIAFSLYYSFLPIFMAILGGTGTAYGPVVGAVILGYLDTTLRARLFNYFYLCFGIIMVLIILFLPSGIAGLAPILQERLAKLTAGLRKGGQGEQHANT
jgi:branched-chain amino acid transport system permease protein